MTSSKLTYKELETQIDECMLIDRFRLRRELKKKRVRAGLAAAVDRSLKLVASRRDSVPRIHYPEILPISDCVDEIRAAIIAHPVIIVAGETGSGKTTQLPKICLEAGRGIVGQIGHTQPRRVAARTIASRLAEELDVKPGNEVGFQVRFQDETRDTTLIKVMTDGVLLAEIQQDQYLERYDTIIIDEAHERSLNIDFILGYLKRVQPKRPDLKVIITSATIDVERFSSHFDGAPVIEVSGRAFPVDIVYRPLEVHSKTDDSDELMIKGIIDALKEIDNLEKQRNGDVLIFLPGEREIRETAHEIKKSGISGLEILPLYSRLSIADQDKVFRPRGGGRGVRRIVLATNVAETSLTVPGIRFVIDPGLARISRYSYRSKVQQLPIEPIAQASARQRMGRCGRLSDGVCFRLYSEEDFLARPEFTLPEIMRTNLAAVILQMLQLRLGDMNRFPFLERPNPRQVNDGFGLLFELGAVDHSRKITRLGKQLARFPVDLRFARMLLAAGQQGCLRELLIIASALAIADPRERPFDHQQAADEAHKKFWHEQSDFLALTALWDEYETQRQNLSQNQLRKYCRANFLSFVRMREWRSIHRQLLLLVKELGFKQNRTPADYATVHRAVLTGFLGHISQKTGDNEYQGARNRKQFIFPGSSQFKTRPQWIVASEIVETSRLFARTVAEIDISWIEPLAGHLIQYNHFDPFYDSKRGQVLVREEVSLYGLTIVSNREVDYGSVDSIAARELFIQKALVEGELRSTLKFFKHNMRLIREVESLESKTRKRDILVETRALFDFYDQRLPGGISSEIDLAAYVNGNSREVKRLFLTKQELMAREALLAEELYPDSIHVADSSLKLKYKFEPDLEDDGVNVDVPLALLNQVSKAQLDWVVPGLLREKCLALIKSLPKSIRKNFVPAPEYVDRVLVDFEFDGRDLATTLADRLFRVTGTRVDAEDFQQDALARHLNLNIRVLDEQGTMIASGRNLDGLIDELSDEVARQFNHRANHAIEREGISTWDFGELPEQVELSAGKIKVAAYVALVDQLDSVSIELMESKWQAELQTEAGLLRLFLLQLSDQKKYLMKNIPGFQEFSLYYATRGDRGTLMQDIVTAVFQYTFIEGERSVRTQQAFDERLEKKSELFQMLEEVSRLISVVLKTTLHIEQQLIDTETELKRPAFDDIRSQINRLVAPGFPKAVPLKWLRQYPRYLKAIEYRLDRLSGNLEKDQLSLTDLARYWGQFDRADFSARQRLTNYRWMLEELRVSLFAQAIGTSMPVSAKRLAKEWETVMGKKQ